MSAKTEPLRRSKRLQVAIQLGLFVVVFLVLRSWQLRDSLDTDTLLPSSMHVADITGQKVAIDFKKAEKTLLYFFAPWCTVCHYSMSNLQWLYELEQDDRAIYLIALSFEQQSEISDFISEHELTVPVLLGNTAIERAFKIQGFPTYFVINQQGKIVARDIGYSSMFGLWWRNI